MPFSPPITNSGEKAEREQHRRVITGRPCQIVAIQANTCTVLKIEIVMLAALKKLIAIWVMPVANMWCTHTPKPTTPVSTVASAT